MEKRATKTELGDLVMVDQKHMSAKRFSLTEEPEDEEAMGSQEAGMETKQE